MSNETQHDPGELLESECPYCSGKGRERIEGSGKWRTCFTCSGAGFIPTEFGKMVLALMRHNFRPMFERMQNRDDL